MSPTGRKNANSKDSFLSMVKASFTGVTVIGVEYIISNTITAVIRISKYSSYYSLIFSRVSVSSSTACVKARFE